MNTSLETGSDPNDFLQESSEQVQSLPGQDHEQPNPVVESLDPVVETSDNASVPPVEDQEFLNQDEQKPNQAEQVVSPYQEPLFTLGETKSQVIDGTEPFFFPGGPIGCLLVHGFTGTPKEMRWLGEYLADQGHTVLGIRLFAHATKIEDMKRARWTDWLADVEDGWQLLQGMCQHVFVIGLSMGGILSLLFASKRPLAGVVAMSTPHHLPRDPRLNFIKPISLFVPYMQKSEPSWFDQKALEQHTCYPTDPTRGFAELRDMLKEMRENLAHIQAPTLLVYSKDDPVVTPNEKHMEKIFQELGSLEKQTLWIEKSGHVVVRDAQRKQVFLAVGDFVNRVAKPAK